MADIRNKRLNGNASVNPLPVAVAIAFTAAACAIIAIGRRKTLIDAAATNTNMLRRTVPYGTARWCAAGKLADRHLQRFTYGTCGIQDRQTQRRPACGARSAV